MGHVLICIWAAARMKNIQLAYFSEPSKALEQSNISSHHSAFHQQSPINHNRLHCNGIHRKVQERAMKLCQRHNGPRLLTLYLELHPDPLIGPQVYLGPIKKY